MATNHLYCIIPRTKDSKIVTHLCRVTVWQLVGLGRKRELAQLGLISYRIRVFKLCGAVYDSPRGPVAALQFSNNINIFDFKRSQRESFVGQVDTTGTTRESQWQLLTFHLRDVYVKLVPFHLLLSHHIEISGLPIPVIPHPSQIPNLSEHCQICNYSLLDGEGNSNLLVYRFVCFLLCP